MKIREKTHKLEVGGFFVPTKVIVALEDIILSIQMTDLVVTGKHEVGLLENRLCDYNSRNFPTGLFEVAKLTGSRL